MRVEIHHATDFGQPDSRLAHVADVEAPGDSVEDALDFAYAKTQNVSGSWSKGPWVHDARNFDYSETIRVIAPLRLYNGIYLGHRSSSVGDVFVVDGQRFRVAGMGFEKEDS